MKQILFALLLLSVLGCCENTHSHARTRWNSTTLSKEAMLTYLPAGATNMVDRGNGWWSFEFEGRSFMALGQNVRGSFAISVTEVSK